MSEFVTSRSTVRPLLAALLLLNAVTVSTLYWAQSVSTSAQSDFGSSPGVALLASAALGGYAIGVALQAALARDLTTPSGLLAHTTLLSLALAGAAIAPTAPTLLVACFVIGIGCSLTQRALACATSAVPPDQLGPVIGCIIASGLTGIVVARAVVPGAALAFGWRTLFKLDAALICTLGVAAALAAQHVGRGQWSPKPVPLPSAWTLWRRERELRRAAIQQGCVFAAFNAGWAVFPRVLALDGVPGAIPMGIVASCGAFAALAAGWLCRRGRAADVGHAGLCAVIVASLGAGLAATWAEPAGPLTYAAMTLLDVGTQTALVANQARAQARAASPAMRGRLAAIVTTIGFAAGAAGAAIGNALL